MRIPRIRLRDMRPGEYASYTAERERDAAESLSASMPYDEGLAEARHSTGRFLPDGLATAGHRLLVAENIDGELVGYAWLGLADPRTGSPGSAWVYDIRVEAAHRRHGYGGALLAELERIAREAGARRLGLNVFGGNTAAIALYAGRGYEVSTQQMFKPLGQLPT